MALGSTPGQLKSLVIRSGIKTALIGLLAGTAGAAALASYLRELPGGRLPLVFAGMRDKDLDGMLRELVPVVDRLAKEGTMFTSWYGQTPKYDWVGFRNYKLVFADERFQIDIRNLTAKLFGEQKELLSKLELASEKKRKVNEYLIF